METTTSTSDIEFAYIHEADEYENRPYPVMCDICETQDFASEKTLRAKGWELGKGYEFCPSH
jgi:hypothetical protein